MGWQSWRSIRPRSRIEFKPCELRPPSSVIATCLTLEACVQLGVNTMFDRLCQIKPKYSSVQIKVPHLPPFRLPLPALLWQHMYSSLSALRLGGYALPNLRTCHLLQMLKK